ncbi:MULTISPECIES: hypothetical protein [Pseudomonadota]|jgi:membrane-anchored glycerophosphoryl diester phosphodiesterase (GDPDase)|uniref:hypothetical protein n=1 Tax=Pseudomonadota TaxID=1224 RepID=UPI00076A6C1D|nr:MULTISPECIES: hypothetical protein [Pseudomonadota]MAF61872.1 hypothetical protein [Blastomonas sp.]MBA4780296.1 hypothetical protein [Blastomonas sp.]|tara:strand:- start:26937 stop:27779 length:843 start_codon:yes stop_codon:yes gene_type:complete
MDSQRRNFSMGNVISSTFRLIFHNLGLVFGASLVFFGLPLAAIKVFGRNGSSDIAAVPAQEMLWMGITAIVVIVLFAPLQALVAIIAMRTATGGSADLRYTVKGAVRQVPGSIALAGTLALVLLAVIAILIPGTGIFLPWAFGAERQEEWAWGFGFGVILGLGVAVIVLHVLYVLWIVALPAKAIEKVSVLGALRRSRQLTCDARSKITVLIWVYWIFSGIVTLFSGLLMMLGGLGEFIATGVTFAINAAMAAAGSAAIYAELRGTKEGPDTDELASVFA